VLVNISHILFGDLCVVRKLSGSENRLHSYIYFFNLVVFTIYSLIILLLIIKKNYSSIVIEDWF